MKQYGQDFFGIWQYPQVNSTCMILLATSLPRVINDTNSKHAFCQENGAFEPAIMRASQVRASILRESPKGRLYPANRGSGIPLTPTP